MPGAETDAHDVKVDGQRKPIWLYCELTYRCPLKCVWCNNPLDFDRYREHELSTGEWKEVLRQAHALGALHAAFTGGEPATRKDLEELIAEASRLGYYTNLVTSGMELDRDRLGAMKEAGLKQVRLSLPSCHREATDVLVGGRAFDSKVQVARDIKALGLPMVLTIPVCRANIDRTPDILAMAEALGADCVECVEVQYYNWALVNRRWLLPTLDQLERAKAHIMAARQRLAGRTTIYFALTDYYAATLEGDRAGTPRACMNDWGTVRLTVAPDGTALPCRKAGIIRNIDFPSVRKHALDWIWHDSPAFNKFRGTRWMKEPCRSCEERATDFGGCRCQAYLLTGDAANTDPACALSPDHRLIEAAIADAQAPRSMRTPLVRRAAGSVSNAFSGVELEDAP